MIVIVTVLAVLLKKKEETEKDWRIWKERKIEWGKMEEKKKKREVEVRGR